jgi:NitT/TauT family transport system substrate-binding protein
MNLLTKCIAGLAAAVAIGTGGVANATDLRVARSFGLSYLPMIIAEKFHYVEAAANTEGVKDLKVSWSMLSSSGIMYGLLISNQLDIVVGGGPSLIMLWSKTSGTPMAIKGLGSLTTQAQVLMTRDPNVKTVADFTDKNRIAVNTVMSSSAAIVLQVAAARQWGDAAYGKLDRLTVSMPHPEAYAALASGRSEVDSHVTNDPYLFYERKLPGVHQVFSSFDLLGRHSNGIFLTSSTFYNKDPRLSKAFIEGIDRANEFIKANPEKAAQIYIEATGDKMATVAELIAMMDDPDFEYTTTPKNVLPWARFMAQTHSIKNAPDSWKALFFPLIHDRQGS